MEQRGRPVHVPVLSAEVLEALRAPAGDRLEGLVVDATVGAGGHAALVLESFPGVQLLGLDQDPDILALARGRLEPFGDRVRLERRRLSGLSRLLRKESLGRPVAILMDLGASSLQLDRPERGFSFLYDGPLDMRMDPERERTAADIVNTWDEPDLADLFFHEGGEHGARRIARAIVAARRRAPFKRTAALADLIESSQGRSGGGRIHPATRCFQALRRAVNEEGDELMRGLEAAECWLADQGVLAVLSFHSGEDGAVKRFFSTGAREGRWSLLNKKPIRATREEQRANSRSRSARLRAALRTRCPDEAPGESSLAGSSTERGGEEGGAS